MLLKFTGRSKTTVPLLAKLHEVMCQNFAAAVHPCILQASCDEYTRMRSHTPHQLRGIMSSRFDQSLEFQIGLIYTAGMPWGMDRVERLLRRFSKGALAGPLGLGHLNKPVELIKVLSIDSLGQSLEGRQWHSKNRLWRLAWVPNRLDLYFDARAYADIQGQETLSVKAFVDQVGPTIYRAIEPDEAKPIRMSLLMTGVDAVDGEGVAEIANNYLDPRFRRMPEGEELLEAQVRINENVEWDLNGVICRINRITNKVAGWQIRVQQVERDLTTQLDCNTSPLNTVFFSPTNAEIFFKKSADWMDKKVVMS